MWGLWGVVLGVVVATYTRLEPGELYLVSGEGLAGGLSRGLVLVNFPIALVSIGLVLMAAGALPRRAWWIAAPAIALSAVVAWPGVVDQDDLDARWINAIPALGVLLGLLLTAWAARRAGSSFAPRASGDRARIVVAALVFVLSLPWVVAELGSHLPGDVFLGEEPYREDDGTVLAAVHLGHHHGTDGALLLLTTLLLSRVRVTGRGLRTVFAAYVALMSAYGTVNFTQDLWHEQVVKRGWTTWDIPSALVPHASWSWAVVLAGAALLYAFGFARSGEDDTQRR